MPHPKPDAKHPRLLSLNWSEYVEEIEVYGEDHLKRRVALLHRATEIFASANSFAELSSLERKALAGFIGVRERDASPCLAGMDWGCFGSMKGAGVFKNRVSDKDHAGRADADLSAALDCIAPTGAVTETDYKRFVECSRNAFTGAARQGQIASASRLLAMKRPDYFVCVNSENKRELSQDLGFSAGMLTLRLTGNMSWNR